MTRAPGEGHGGGGAGSEPAARRRRRLRSSLITALGVVLVWGTLGAVGYAWGWTVHQHRAQGALVSAEHAVESRHRARHPCVVQPPQPGQLAGLLSVPALQLQAPVEEGTDDAQLAVAVGHDPDSVWPGSTGTAVFLAHDVSYFVHLNQLQPGDTITYQTACNSVTYTVTSHQVVAQGSAVPDSSTPTLVLDTCYPPDALFFTTQRYLVFATEDPVSGAPGPGHLGAVPAADHVAYKVPAPPALVAQGLTLEQNEAPMGTMTLAGQTSPSWEQSPGPLAVETAALEAYFGGLHAASSEQYGWWLPIAQPGVEAPLPLVGAEVTGHDAPLDVQIDSTDGAVTSVVLTTTVTLSGGAAPGTYAESVSTAVHGDQVTLAGWTLTPE